MGGIGLLGGLASSIVSGVQAKKASNAATAEYQEKKGFLENMFNRQYYQDITKRTDVQNMLRLLQENQDKQAKRDEAVAAITGATPEAQLAAQDSRNKSYADALAEIASNASTLKDTYLQNYQNQRMALVNPQAQIHQNMSNMWGQAGSNLFGSGAKMLGSGIDGIVKAKE
jgi:citrate synthase